MPVLETTQRTAAERCQFPREASGHWYVLHANARQEKALARSLRAMGIACFLPLIREARVYGPYKLIVEMALFPGYLFMRGESSDVGIAQRTQRVARVIAVADQPQLDWELGNLHRAVDGQVPLDPHPYRSDLTRVEVRSGPLLGLQGFIEDPLAIDKLILQVQMLGSAVSLRLGGAQLERLTW